MKSAKLTFDRSMCPIIDSIMKTSIIQSSIFEKDNPLVYAQGSEFNLSQNSYGLVKINGKNKQV